MPYPNELLPKANYKNEIDPDILLNDSPDYFLIRISSCDIEDIENIKIREICKQTKDFINMSSNLLGIYSINHLMFKPINRPNNDDWQKDNGSINPDEIQFDEINAPYPIFIKIDSLHNKNFPAEKQGQNSKSINIKIKLIHKPKKPNYWHLELNLFDENDIEIDREALPDWQKRGIKLFLETDIIHKAKGILPDVYTVIEGHNYIDQ